MKMLRTVLGYAAMAVGVTVGGVLVGAIVIAPAVSRTKPFIARFLHQSSIQQTEGSGSAVGQADGDPMLGTPVASEVSLQAFKPMAAVIASTKEVDAQMAQKSRRSGWAAFKYQAADRVDDVRLWVGRVPKILWVYADIGAVLLMATVWFWRRRKTTGAGNNPLSLNDLDRLSVSSLPNKLTSGKGSRTPKAVVALAEAGRTPADIARRTGLPLDAVSMLLCLGAIGTRQLQPPTA